MTRTAVVLFNLGGPDSLDAVRPFLLNLFSDPAILTVRQPLRWLLARLIASRRAPAAREIYARLGGRSPLLDQTVAQAQALEAALAAEQGKAEAPAAVRVFVAMRYWRPRAAEVVEEVKRFGAERIVLLPLYPQFSTTSSGSSLAEWKQEAARAGLEAPTSTICCHPTEAGFIRALASLTLPHMQRAAERGKPRLLVSAHGLPERVIRRGDPYAWQVERSAAALGEALRALAPDMGRPEIVVAYQSRATPEPWLKPDTVDEIRRAGKEGRPLVIVPIAFVSEHSETVIELDEDYAAVAREAGVPAYHRVPTVRVTPAYIEGLAKLVREALAAGPGLRSERGPRLCPPDRRGCPFGSC